jgi:uncharacterized membrane protein YccF (DUF307 family)
VDRKDWLDHLTDGQIIRDWTSLNVHLFLGIGYWVLLLSLLGLAVGLTVVLIGIPLLLMSFAAIPALAKADQQMIAGLLEDDAPEIEIIDTRGDNLGERLGRYLGTRSTWASALYLFLKVPVGVLAITFAWMIVPFLAFEVLVLAPLTLSQRPLTVRMLHWTARGLHRLPGMLLPRAKRKGPLDWRDARRLIEREDDEPAYYLDDDGERVDRYQARR